MAKEDKSSIELQKLQSWYWLCSRTGQNIWTCSPNRADPVARVLVIFKLSLAQTLIPTCFSLSNVLCPEETSLQLLEWVPVSSSDLCGDEVLREAPLRLHYLVSTSDPGATAVCSPLQPIHGWCQKPPHPHGPGPAGWRIGRRNYVQVLLVDYG